MAASQRVIQFLKDLRFDEEGEQPPRLPSLSQPVTLKKQKKMQKAEKVKLPQIPAIESFEVSRATDEPSSLPKLEAIESKIQESMAQIEKARIKLDNEREKREAWLEEIRSKKAQIQLRTQEIENMLPINRIQTWEVEDEPGTPEQQIKDKYIPLYTPIVEATRSQELLCSEKRDFQKQGKAIDFEKQEEKCGEMKEFHGLEPCKQTFAQAFPDSNNWDDFGAFDGLDGDEAWFMRTPSDGLEHEIQKELKAKFGIIFKCERGPKELIVIKKTQETQEVEGKNEEIVEGDGMPDYWKMAPERLKQLAGKYGMKPSLGKRDLVNTLEEIWKYQKEGVRLTEYERLVRDRERGGAGGGGRVKSRKESGGGGRRGKVRTMSQPTADLGWPDQV